MCKKNPFDVVDLASASDWDSLATFNPHAAKLIEQVGGFKSPTTQVI